MNASKKTIALVGATSVMVTALAACSSGANADSSSTGSASLTQVSVWDPYPQYDDSSDWATYVKACAPAGTTLKRTTAPTSDLLNTLTSAVKEDNAPDVVILDNPAVPDAASSGLLAPASDVGIDTTGFDANLAGPGTVDGVTYGVPIGANTLGLYYNKDILDNAGVDPASITSWDTLNAALEKVTKAGNKGITFAGVAGEEGVFQFLPWFWGSGANLKAPGSDEAVAAGQLVSDWIGKGYAPKSALTDNQSASWDLFLTGQYAFAENGSWFAKAASEQKFKAVMMPIPGKDNGAAPVPTGGEFVLAPVHKKDTSAHYAAAAKIIACLAGPDNQIKTDDQLGYFAANKDQRTQQIASDPIWTPWAQAIESAQGRTTDLGADYTATSAAISTALQGALNAAGDTSAVKSAFAQAAQG
ncbi:sugar ABC transporter substrate-binding protein [Xylanimonas sp. McL0601]|uniref:sugar ABC transporter substrate-binding protein n=1 Tax=Xylanimonas sp. McL0601 TaxID=3414739 RepID=UPI003CF292DD